MAEESIASEVLSASLGGAISASILYPLEVLKTKMQAETRSDNDDDDDDDDDEEEEDKSKLNMIEYARYLYKTQGIQVFFSGFETSAFQSAVEKALYFFAYTGLKRIYRALHGGATPKTFASLVLGCCAEWAHLPVTLPLDCWTTAIQTNRDASRGPMQLLLSMLSEKKEGLASWFQGLGPELTRGVLSSALMLMIKDQIGFAVQAAIAANQAHGKKSQPRRA
ncbi:hypothetical protein MHU86_7345 [Fragilaria crotonensis]|nr:hypothetical protein MHU86_7345 [Fragilaria crotonensis]